MACLKNWTDNLFQIFLMGTSWVAVSINNIKTRASSEMTSRKNIKIFDFNGVNVAKHWHVAGRGICHLWMPCCYCYCSFGRFPELSLTMTSTAMRYNSVLLLNFLCIIGHRRFLRYFQPLGTHHNRHARSSRLLYLRLVSFFYTPFLPQLEFFTNSNLPPISYY